ncbi:DUF4157 domain-containing protein [Streptomyces sp. NPDC060027]|uniref:eCIS core domain-containing protein n=1 Tax=Streptomyces sp. NPDC060027 TaxID=3347040 RepID=UPI003687C82A
MSVFKPSQGSGEALRPDVRHVMESRLGTDFSTVRVHTDGESAAAAQQLRAAAFTRGSDIAFAPGTYAPHTLPGAVLLVHELVHVAQNRTRPVPAGAPPLSRGGADISERQAHQVVERFMAGSPRPMTVPVGPDAALSLADEFWYRGYAEGAAVARDGPYRHDLGEGLYFSDEPDVANEYGALRAQEQGKPTSQRLGRVKLDQNKMGRVFDFTKELDFMKYYEHTKATLKEVSGDPYRNLVENHLRVKNIKLEDFDILIGPEGIRGGRQMCIRNPALIKSALDRLEHQTPGGGTPGTGGGTAPPTRGGQARTPETGGAPPSGKLAPAARKPAPAPVAPEPGRMGRWAIGFFKGAAPMIATGINSYLMAQKDASYVRGRVERALAEPELNSKADDLIAQNRLSIARAQRQSKKVYLTISLKLVFTNGIQDSLFIRDPVLTYTDETEWSSPIRMSDEPLAGAETTVGRVTQSVQLRRMEVSRSEELGFRIQDLQAEQARDAAAVMKGGGFGEVRRREIQALVTRLQQAQQVAHREEERAMLAELVRPAVTADLRTRTKEQAAIADRLRQLQATSPMPGQAAPAPHNLTPPPAAPGLLPGTPQGDPIAQAAAVVQELRRQTDLLEATARAMESRLGTPDPPTLAERQSFFVMEERWRLSVKFAMNKFKDTNRDEAVNALGELLDRRGGGLALTRGYLGG